MIENAYHSDSTVPLADEIYNQDVIIVGMGLTVLAVRIGRVHEYMIIPAALLYHAGAFEFNNTGLDSVNDLNVFGMGVFRLKRDERVPERAGNPHFAAVHCPTSSGLIPISARISSGIFKGSSPESSSIRPYSWASARNIAKRTSSE